MGADCRCERGGNGAVVLGSKGRRRGSARVRLGHQRLRRLQITLRKIEARDGTKVKGNRRVVIAASIDLWGRAGRDFWKRGGACRKIVHPAGVWRRVADIIYDSRVRPVPGDAGFRERKI